jgi:zinc transporter 9
LETSPASTLQRWGASFLTAGDDAAQAKVNSDEAMSAAEQTRSNVKMALTGNVLITTAKFGAWMSCGSSAMLSEAIHSLVDSGNQALLLVGLRDVGRVNDASHPYGYGKSIYFWSLVSALGTFWLGAGVSLTHSVSDLMHPSLTTDIPNEVWAVLAFSFVIDGRVFLKVLKSTFKSKPANMSIFKFFKTIRDPATVAVLLEDGAACTGVLIAGTGIALAHVYEAPVFDGLAGVSVSLLLAGMGLALARLNQQYLLGQAVDREIVTDINNILMMRGSIDNVHSVQSQWTGPYSFSYKAEVDFDGTYLAAKLMERYEPEFKKSMASKSLDTDLKLLLSWYAEDVMRSVEREVKDIETEIRASYPAAAYIELEPDSKDSNLFAIEQGGREAGLRGVEMKALNEMILQLKQLKEREVRVFSEADRDGDNKLSKHEVAAILKQQYGSVDIALVAEMFARFAKSNDSKSLSLKEYREALQVYRHKLNSQGSNNNSNFPPLK